MQITNKHGLPAEIYDVLARDDYKQRGNISVTQLVGPPRIRMLTQRHLLELTVDATDRFAMMLGTALHQYLAEKMPGAIGWEKEKTFFLTVNGWLLHGTVDYIKPQVIWDHKLTSVWSYVFGVKPEWEKQLNVYAYLSEMNDRMIKELYVIMWFKDFLRYRAGKDGYPDAPVKQVPVELWTIPDQKEYVIGRVRAHKRAEDLPDDNLPLCTPEERWESPTTYAVMKKGRKSALRVLDSELEAVSWMDTTGKGEYIETRPGKAARCEHYCDVRDFCNQYNEIKEAA